MDAQVRQNLVDAGCSEAFVEEFGRLGTTQARLRLLRRHRRELLGAIHGEQAKLDRLDYLIFQMKGECRQG